ncbi:MAG: hypothetical protein ACI4WS_07855 [Oscillospiraceae bacterium]
MKKAIAVLLCLACLTACTSRQSSHNKDEIPPVPTEDVIYSGEPTGEAPAITFENDSEPTCEPTGEEEVAPAPAPTEASYPDFPAVYHDGKTFYGTLIFDNLFDEFYNDKGEIMPRTEDGNFFIFYDINDIMTEDRYIGRTISSGYEAPNEELECQCAPERWADVYRMDDIDGFECLLLVFCPEPFNPSPEKLMRFVQVNAAAYPDPNAALYAIADRYSVDIDTDSSPDNKRVIFGNGEVWEYSESGSEWTYITTEE